jgi:hypothetical protein
MTKRNIETLLRVVFGAWGVGLVVLSFSAVAICDTCGAGGDEAFRWLGAVSGVIAVVVAVSRRAAPSLQWGLLALQVVLVVAAYESAGAGAGAVRISPVIAVIGAALEATGVGVVALVAPQSRPAAQ